MAKFLLVLPYFGRGRGYDFPLGIAYVSGALKAAGHEVRCLNLNHETPPVENAVAEAVAAFDPDVCATGTLSPYYRAAETILVTARRVKPGILTVLGGGLLTASPEKVMAGLGADFGVIGEGERTVVELAEALGGGRRMEGVDGLILRDGRGETRRTRPRAVERDFGSLPWPDFEGFGIEWMLDRQASTDRSFFHRLDQPRCLPMVSSRSCPFDCTFCFHPTGRIYRERPLDDFFAELDHLVARYRINMIEILDELFAIKSARVEEFCHRIKPYGLRWSASLHTTTVTERTVETMVDAGCTLIGLGLESVHPAVLKSMNKKTSQAKIERALDAGFGKGVAIRGNFIFGDPAETLETANFTLDWWARHPKYRISLIHLQILPGSPVYEEAARRGTIPDDPSLNWNQGTNVTALDDRTYLRLRNRTGVFSAAMVVPAEILSFDEAPDGGDGRRRHRIRWRCPFCAAENDFRDVALDRPDFFQGLDLSCRTCGAFASIENRARAPWRHPEAEAHLARGRKMRKEGRRDEAIRELKAAASVPVPADQFDRPAASLEALLILGEMLLEVGRTEEAADLLGFAVQRKAFDPLYHLAFASALLREGCLAAAAMHHRQAELVSAYLGMDAYRAMLDSFGGLLAEARKAGLPGRFI